MADKRKLQGEIDRCLKRVAEGVEQFEDIWKKVHNASNANQKEKYEADLKKEIKKLQRLRDQIKTWLTSNDIKDKRPLMDNRRLIETQMERFKVVERETKTKAYSKEGLGLAAKVDPAQKEKEEVRHWLTDSIYKLNLQIDQFESEVESVYAGSKKKKLDRDRSDRVEELQGWVERHKFHVQKLETIMRMMDNCTLETESVKAIQDDLNYYVDSNQEPDFAENELIYEDMDLDETGSSSLYTAAAVAGATHPPVSEEEMNSIPTSPSTSSQGPLSPKTPTTMKSTSQELFEERRRGKTSVSSSEHPNEVPSQPQPQSHVVPPSPKKPTSGSKSFLQNSSLPSRSSSGSGSGSKSTTPSSGKGNALPNSKGSSASHATTPSSAASENSSQRGPSKPAQPPSGPAYAIAAGGHQNSVSSPASTPSSSQPSATQTPVTPAPSSQTRSSTPPLPSASSQIPTPASSVTSSVEINSSNSSQPQQPSPQSHLQASSTSQPRPQVPVSLQLQHSRSSSGSSSLSPSTLSQESQPAPPQLPSGTAAVGSAVTTVDTSSGSVSVPSSGSAASMQHSQVGTPTSESGAISVETSHTHTSPSNQSSSLSPSSHPAPPSSPAPYSQQQVVSGWPDQTSSRAAPGRTTQGEAVTVSNSTTLPSSSSIQATPVGSSTSSGALQGLPSLPQLPLLPSLPSEGSSNGSSLLPVWMSAGSVGGLPSMVTLPTFVSTGSSTGLLTQTTPASMMSPVSMASSSAGETQPSSSSSTPFTSAFTSATPSTSALAPTLFSSAGFLSSEILPSTSETSGDSLSSLKSIAAQVVASNSLSAESKPESSEPMLRPLFDPTMAAPGTRLENVAQTRTDTQLQPLLGVTPLGPVQLSQEKLYQLKMLEGACKHMPQPSDSERVRPYLQRTPYPTHYYHHQHPPPHFDSFEFFQRLSIETLFFIFYYMEGTKAQYMAAKALKKLSWRFHTKYMMWFQRLEEPKAITDDYEMGTYIYFDFEKWSQRKKEGFTFEYRYLEDKDLP